VELLAMELQGLPPAPGRGEVTQTSQPPPGGPPAGGPGPGSGSGGGMSMSLMLLMLVPMILVIFLMNRSQTKKQKELEGKLKKGDRVVTTGGIVGKIADMGPRYVRLELAPGVKVQMLKTAIQGLDAGEDLSGASKEASKGKTEGSDTKDSPSESKK
jgi:preprotein translocase subunit YajC